MDTVHFRCSRFATDVRHRFFFFPFLDHLASLLIRRDVRRFLVCYRRFSRRLRFFVFRPSLSLTTTMPSELFVSLCDVYNAHLNVSFHINRQISPFLLSYLFLDGRFHRFRFFFFSFSSPSADIVAFGSSLSLRSRRFFKFFVPPICRSTWPPSVHPRSDRHSLNMLVYVIWEGLYIISVSLSKCLEPEIVFEFSLRILRFFFSFIIPSVSPSATFTFFSNQRHDADSR